MANLTQDQLKALFESGDMPTEDNFGDMIDTLKSHSAISTLDVVAAGTPVNVWTDFNAGYSIDQKTKEVYIVTYYGIYYMFNSDIGIYGDIGIQTDASNFIQVSPTLNDVSIPVNNYTFHSVSQAGLEAITTTTLVDYINTTTTITHDANAVTTIQDSPGSFSDRLAEIHYLFNAPSGTYGSGNTPVNASHLIDISRVRYEQTIEPKTISVVGTGNVWTDFNQTVPFFWVDTLPTSQLYIVYHNNKTYLFKPEIAIDGSPKYSYGNGGSTTTSSNNFVLLTEQHEIDKLEGKAIIGNWNSGQPDIEFDFNDYDNFLINITSTDSPPVTPIGLDAVNLTDGKSGYIKFSRPGYPIGDVWAWNSPFLMIDSASVADGNQTQYYLYEIVSGKVLIYKSATEGLAP